MSSRDGPYPLLNRGGGNDDQRTGLVLVCVLLAVLIGVGLRAKRDARTAPPPAVTLPPDDPLPEPQAITRECVSVARLVLAKQYHGADGQSNRLTGVKALTPGLWQVRGELTAVFRGVEGVM
ncbi:hypothetical protein [Deinococcus sp. PEB2-63]